MNHWIIMPIVLPALMAPLIVLGLRHNLALQRIFSLAATGALVALATGLTFDAASGPPQVYEVGNWPAPYGIVLVLDRLSALMLLVASVLALAVAIYAAHGWDSRGRHFHALFQFQLMGVNGAFLTGDVFNLFVFFEVLLIASYGLMLHGGGAARLRAGVQYVVINLAASTLFLIAIGLLYGVTGTLNMADLALRVAEVDEADRALLSAGALLLLVVFAVKAAVVPLHFWLPGAYAAAPAPVAALFAIMSKVGAYAILRVHSLVFGESAGEAAWIAGAWLLPAALVTLAVGMVGVLAGRSLRSMSCFAVISSMGTLLVAIALFTEQATASALYYLVNSTLAAGALFLVADLVAERRGGSQDRLVGAPAIAQSGVIAALFFAAALATIGMPPLSGFFGKLMILDSARASPAVAWIWALILAASLFAIAAFARAGSLVFWKPTAEAAVEETAQERRPVLPLVATGALVAGTALLALFAGPAMDYFEATAAQLFNPAGYIGAVLGTDALPPGMLAAR